MSWLINSCWLSVEPAELIALSRVRKHARPEASSRKTIQAAFVTREVHHSIVAGAHLMNMVDPDSTLPMDVQLINLIEVS